MKYNFEDSFFAPLEPEQPTQQNQPSKANIRKQNSKKKLRKQIVLVVFSTWLVGTLTVAAYLYLKPFDALNDENLAHNMELPPPYTENSSGRAFEKIKRSIASIAPDNAVSPIYPGVPVENIILLPSTSTQIVESHDVRSRELLPLQPNQLARPNRLVCSEQTLYFLALGKLYSLPIEGAFDTQKTQAKPLFEGARFKIPFTGEPVRELSDLAIGPELLYLLDKSNDVYTYKPETREWKTLIPAAPTTQQPDPHYIGLEHYNNTPYLLDYARNQISKLAGKSLTGFFPREVMSWEIKPGDHNIVEGIDMYIDGQVYILHRNGDISLYEGGRVKKQPFTSLAQAGKPLNQKIALRSLRGDKDFLYVVDAGNQRIIQIDKKEGRVKKQWLLANNDMEWHQLHDISFCGGKMLALAGNLLLEIPMQASTNELGSQSTFKYQNIHPVDSLVNNFQKPIPTAQLPDNAGILPGARRLYRYGIHEGSDFFDPHNPQMGGKQVHYKSQVEATQNGVVTRIDKNFVEMTPAIRDQALAESKRTHQTSRLNEDKFRGRQVWIEHPNGITTVYSHLSGVVSDINVGDSVKKGQLIGFVGNSGTSNGVSKNMGNPHLHLEIWLRGVPDHDDGEYLGKWLSLTETRDLWERIFK